MANLDLMNRQYGAITGRRKRFPHDAFIEGRIPSLYQAKARAEQQKMDQRNFGLQEQTVGLAEEELTESKRVSDIELGLRREALDQAAKQAKVATGLGVAQTGLGAAYVGNKIWSGWGDGGGAVSSASVPGSGGGMGPGELGAGGGWGSSSTGLAPWQRAGIAAGIELQRPYISKPASKWGAENLPGGEKEWSYIENVGTRAGQGYALGGGTGAVIGAGVGLLESALDCIIISAATGRHSPEVEIAREYRDKYLDLDTLRGYYMIAELVVPMMERFAWLKRVVKVVLVDPLVSYCAYSLTKTSSTSLYSKINTKAFLESCKLVGLTRMSYTRNNGEVF